MKNFLIVGSLIMVLLVSCVQEEFDEFEGLIDVNQGDPLAFLDATNKYSIDESEISSSRNKSLITFSSEYIDIKEWGKLQLSQKELILIKPESNSLLDMLVLSRQGERQNTFLPIDTVIGPLMDYKDTSYVDTKIYKLVDTFFLLMKKQELDKDLSTVVMASEIPIISRQILRSSEYAQDITEVRVGKIKSVDADKRSAAVRVIAKRDDTSARTKLNFYFISEDGEWLINAIEGDLNRLKNNYVSPGKFVPQGTTGVTQGF